METFPWKKAYKRASAFQVSSLVKYIVYKIVEKNKKIEQEFKDESFMGLNLNEPGTIIELNDGRRLLIGDILNNGAGYGDEDHIDYNSIVVRYAKLDLKDLW